MIELTQEETDYLLSAARGAIEARVLNKPYTPSEQESGTLRMKAGVFVSLHQGTRLRGCIGTFYADQPLVKQVMRMAVSSAFEDVRFSPLTKAELPDLDIEISILSPLREITDVNEIEVGTHGIYITKGFHRGVLLPQVATDYGWDRETFLDHTCMKAGMSEGSWRSGAKIEIFSSLIISEKKVQ
jgi:uncharacterized protein